jgi:hypothetical protein
MAFLRDPCRKSAEDRLEGEQNRSPTPGASNGALTLRLPLGPSLPASIGCRLIRAASNSRRQCNQHNSLRVRPSQAPIRTMATRPGQTPTCCPCAERTALVSACLLQPRHQTRPSRAPALRAVKAQPDPLLHLIPTNRPGGKRSSDQTASDSRGRLTASCGSATCGQERLSRTRMGKGPLPRPLHPRRIRFPRRCGPSLALMPGLWNDRARHPSRRRRARAG